MLSIWRATRRRILTPNSREAKLSVRGFHEKSPEARELLERAGETFLSGYGIAAEADGITIAEDMLEQVPPEFRGFAYEGAGMGFAVRQGLPCCGRHVASFLEGRADSHIYMVYIGVGWALARLPRFRWTAATRGLSDPVLRWLALDGYGFHQAYFHTDKYVYRHYQAPDFSWPTRELAGYAQRVIDQGIGRAVWFVCGADPERVADVLDAFPPGRQGDLYSGAGLAATYAGGADQSELQAFLDRGHAFRPQIAQGSAFAATARVRAGLVGPGTALATEIFCQSTPAEAAHVTLSRRPEPAEGGDIPAWELWRIRVAMDLASPASEQAHWRIT